MKKLLSIILVIFTLFSLSFCVFAENVNLEELITEDIFYDKLPEELFEDTYNYPSNGKNFVIDEANLFTPQQKTVLINIANKLYSEYGFELVLYTTRTAFFVSIQDYADDFYDYNDYGDNGMLFMVSLKERDYYTSTTGYAIDIFGGRKLDKLHSYMLEDLSNDQFYNAFYKYAEEVALSVEAYNNGTTHSVPLNKSDMSTLIKKEIFVLIIFVIITFVVMKSLEKSLNTANKKTEASNYINYGSFSLSHSNDLYVTTNVTRTPKSNNNSSGRSGSHRSSSGRSHGGGGGKF